MAPLGRGWFPVVLVLAACSEDDPKPPAPLSYGSGDEGASSTSTGGCGPQDPACACELPHSSCPGDATDPLYAMGLCPDRVDTGDASFTAETTQIGVVEIIGAAATFLPREGNTMTALGTGLVSDFQDGGPCNHDYAPAELPAPITVDGVGDVDCNEDPSLVGTGDCSNTIAAQFEQGGPAFDYAEIRVTTTVPEGASAVKFDFAFFSTEYPEFYGSEFNDMFVAWLDSEMWTGNISFDDHGNPISLNAGFLDFRDDDGDLPQFEASCMQGHASTRWLTSQAPVGPAETITLVLAIFDLSDQMFDSYVLLDDFRWGCDDAAGGPSTVPQSTSTAGDGADSTAGPADSGSGGSTSGGSDTGSASTSTTSGRSTSTTSSGGA